MTQKFLSSYLQLQYPVIQLAKYIYTIKKKKNQFILVGLKTLIFASK